MSNEVIELKAKMFDLMEQANDVNLQNQQFAQALQAIAQLVGVTPDEQGQVQIETIVSSVQALVPAEEVEAK